jgi:beta-alanine--pyruvate transaminase
MPSMARVRFVSSGTEAAMSAIRVARAATKRDKIVKFEGCYHGHADAFLVQAGSGAMTLGVPNSPGVPAAVAAQTILARYNDLASVTAAVEANRNQIAAIIVEPIAGNMGVVPPADGFLNGLRDICDRHGILLIFDEVITGFGRLGHAFAAERYGVVPDMITFAKGVTSGTVPMGGVIARKGIYDAFMKGPEHAVELFHGYTYSAHPLACAAGLATLDLYAKENLFERARTLEPKWADAMHALKGLPNVLDIRTIGLVAAFDLASIPDAVGKRAFKAMDHAFHELGLMIRIAGETLVVTPPLIVSEAQIGEIADKVGKTIKAVA